MADMNGYDVATIVWVYNQLANARRHIVGLPWSYMCATQCPCGWSVKPSARKNATGDRKKTGSSIEVVWAWFILRNLHEYMSLWMGNSYSQSSNLCPTSHPHFQEADFRFFGMGQQQMNENTGCSGMTFCFQDLGLPGFRVLGLHFYGWEPFSWIFQ